MTTRSHFFQKCAKYTLASVMTLVVVLSSGVGIPTAYAETDAPVTSPVYPCGIAAGPFAASGITAYECHIYDNQKAINAKLQRTWQFAVGTALLNGLSYFTQRIATDMADWMVSGFQGGGPAFYRDGWAGFYENVGKGALNSMITSMAKSDFMTQDLGINICAPITLNLKLMLGLNAKTAAFDTSCGYDVIGRNFEQTYRSLDPQNLATNLKTIVQKDSDVKIQLFSNQKFINDYLKAKEAATLNRQEGGGLKLLTDLISNKIKTPAETFKARLAASDPLGLSIQMGQGVTTVLAAQAFTAGLEQLPMFAAGAFINTLAVGLVTKLFSLFDQPGNDKVDLLSLDVQASAESTTKSKAVLVSDVITPNLVSSDKEDFLFELSSCPTPRGTWGCSMDDAFAQGLRSATENGAYTVSRAAGVGTDTAVASQVFLHKDWELIPETETKDNQDPTCFQRAYCSSNLAKLRFARIIPIGWELAANSPFNRKANGKFVTLGEVMSGFNSCSASGNIDADHPWCHLINPAWVLTAPSFKCQLKGYGDTLLSNDNLIRTQECSDVVSCLKRNDKGECIGGYGFCLSERTVWRFGADECPEKYSSCRTYTSRPEAASAGKDVSYIRNTIDYGQCNQGTIGCMMYATTRDVTTSTSDRWVYGSIPTLDKKGMALYLPDDKFASQLFPKGATMPRTYFTSAAEPCDASGDGCTKLLQVKQGSSALNLVKNGSFENMLKTDATKPDGWFPFGSGPLPFATFTSLDESPSAIDGAQSALLPNVGGLTSVNALFQRVDIYPLRNYVLSFYARKVDDASTPLVQAAISLVQSNGVFVSVGQTYYRSTNCNLDAGGDASLPMSVRPTMSGSPGTAWQRYTCEFVSNKDAAAGFVSFGGSNVAVDGVQLEEGNVVTDYVEGDASNLTATYLKVAPDELKCTGNAKVDRAECGNYARMCMQTDVGCQGYMETGGTGTEIPATLNQTDYCPNSCVGYAEYRKLQSAFDLTSSTDPYLDDAKDDTLAYFVPKNSQICSVDSAGCEEFTNVEASLAGGESKSYFTYARACEKPNENSRTYFTWEGSDVSGYQLRTWSLIKEQDTPGVTPDDLQPGEPAGGPKILRKAGPGGFLKKAEECTEVSWKTGVDVDCRQFYDEAGTPFYRYFSQTILSTASCVDYRKSASTQDDCTKTGGAYQVDTKDCIYKILASESATCSAAAAGCRAYRGTTGQNTTSVFYENFSSGANATFKAEGNGSTADISNEALLVGDHSLKTTGSASFNFQATTGSLYVVSFWAKSTIPPGGLNQTTVTLKANDKTIGTAVLQVDWTRFEIGPFLASVVPSSTIVFAGLPVTTYLDEVNVQRLQDIVYVKRNSWVVPAECDQTAEGIPQAQAMLGCREYHDRKNNVVDVRQFSHLCRFESVGCSAFVNTRNSDDPYAQSFVLNGQAYPGPFDKQWDWLYAGTVTTTRDADRFEYLIDEPAAHCNASQMSCRAFGKPSFNQDGTQSGYQTVYLKDDITKYTDGNGENQMLCRPSELFCDKFVSGPVTSFFRDPEAMGGHVCEWKDRILLNATTTLYGTSYPTSEYSGWFIRGTQKPCYPDKVSSGNTFISEFTSAQNYRGWTTLCPAEQSECTEFRDPNDHTDQAHPSGRSYFFIANDRLDVSSCAGKVDLFGGCILFRDMSSSQLNFNTSSTYANSHANNDGPVSAINCETDKNNPYCQKAGHCVNFTKQPFVGVCDINNGQFDCNNLPTADEHIERLKGIGCSIDNDCRVGAGYVEDQFNVQGSCQLNDTNLVVKVKLDRDCQTWLGCSSAETTYDPGQGKYVDLCTNLQVCDQLGGQTSKNFCGHYVNRAQNAKVPAPGMGFYEPVLRQGRFLDALVYANRPTSFGDSDYTGYSIPNHFQMADLVSKRVGYDLLMKREGPVRNRYIQDYRLVAHVPLGTPATGLTEPYTDAKYSYLNLCRLKQTGQIGYTIPGESPAWCYLAIDTPYTQNALEALGVSNINPRNAQVLATAFEQLADASLSQELKMAVPPPECKANPEADSPFSNMYVKEWNIAIDPVKPKTFADGYAGVNYCEYGENCACSYRKVTYGSQNKYYQLYGKPPVTGVCVGGSKNGSSCVPGADPSPLAASSPTAASTSTVPSEQPVVQCPEGSCQGINSVSFVRGVFGQCLERDRSRIVGGSQLNNPCLVWSPSPVLFGKSDIYHYQPTSGYLPIANSGEYYCAADALPPKTLDVPLPITDDTKTKDFIIPPGAMRDKPSSFFFDENTVSDGNCYACSGNGTDHVLGVSDPQRPFATGNNVKQPFVDGSYAYGGDMGAQCELADNRENGGSSIINGAHMSDQTAGRWIMTERGITASYAEYFIGFNASQWAGWLKDKKSVTAKCDNSEEGQKVCKTLNERNFAFFKFSPIADQGHGMIGCGFSQDWVPGTTVTDYGDSDQLKDKSAAWYAGFNAAFDGVLSPEKADYLRTEDGAHLQKVPCTFTSSYDSNNPNADCFYKYWETGYNSAGQKKFQAQWDGWGGGQHPFDPATFGQAGQSEGSKPFFAIRAMFEDASPQDNANSADELDPSGNQLAGPFQFVGWWITASVPGTESERAIYMTLNIGHADICAEVAQVVAPDTREATPFMDRYQESSGFSIPVLGYTYGTVNPPFGSAMHTRPIGLSPLYQTHGPMPGTVSHIKPPDFTASGEEYTNKGAEYPSGNWAWLTNIFARVYRVYRWYDQPVTKDSYACVMGPRFGAWCPNLAGSNYTVAQQQDISLQYCGYAGTCNTDLVDLADAQALCNSLSGVNAGRPCSKSASTDPNKTDGYHVCHAAPLAEDPTTHQLKPQYMPCKLQPGWEHNEDGNYIGTPGLIASNAPAAAAGSGVANPGSNTLKMASYATLDPTFHFGCNVNAGTLVCTPSAVKNSTALRCAPGTVRWPDGELPTCSAETEGADTSADCPKQVIGGVDSFCQAGHCSGPYKHALCKTDSDCEFTWVEWWGNSFKPDSKDPKNNSATRPALYKDLVGGKYTWSHDVIAYNGTTDVKTAPYDAGGKIPHYGIVEDASAGISLTQSTPYGLVVTDGVVDDESSRLGAFYAFDDSGLFLNSYAYLMKSNYGHSPSGDEETGVDSSNVIHHTIDVSLGSERRVLGVPWWAGSDSTHSGTQSDKVIDTNVADPPAVMPLKGADGSNGTDIAGHDLSGGRYVVRPAAHSSVTRFPGTYKAIVLDEFRDSETIDSLKDRDIYIPGHCEKPPDTDDNGCLGSGMSQHDSLKCMDSAASDALFKYCRDSECDKDDEECRYKCMLSLYSEDAPYKANPFMHLGVYDPGTLTDDTLHPGLLSSKFEGEDGSVFKFKRYSGDLGDPSSAWLPGVCEGGAKEGSSCSKLSDCTPIGLDQATLDAARFFCKPVSQNSPNGKVPNAGPGFDCLDHTAPQGANLSLDADTDDNLCTHNAGYYPRADLCGNSSNRAECLTAYTHSNINSIGTPLSDSVITLGKPPTDVTGGLYNLWALGQANGKSNQFSEVDERYIAHYVPRPPTIAAPDTTRACPAAGQCPISRINGFEFENQTEGRVAYVGGQTVSTIRFYAWAADNQGPLKDILVDWGDGHTQELHDGQMKNKKPFCGVAKECESVPGLSCQSDADCPPAMGKCVPTGTCNAKPTVTCHVDADCNLGPKTDTQNLDTCAIRTTFGNTLDACEQNYYEFTHAYACGQELSKAGGLPDCGTTKRCSSNLSKTCIGNSDCAVGDTCLSGLAPINGCYDHTLAACRFTPRVLVKDNWGWCTGECRVEDKGGGKLGSGFKATPNGPVVNKMLFNYGGCYDATGIYKAEDPTQPLSIGAPTMANTCNALLPSIGFPQYRPWIVYPGALQLGVSP